MLNTRAGAFVSLKKHGQLRGCIGTISATKNSVAEEILQNAISAAVSDPRFEAITEDELDELVYNVDVLGDADPIDSPDQLDVKRYDVIKCINYGKLTAMALDPIEKKPFARFYPGVSSVRTAARCHVEVSTLIIPDENDSEEEMEKLALWRSSVDPEIPLHLTRFFPAYQMANKNQTPVETINRLRAIAKKYLHYVYVGNC